MPANNDSNHQGSYLQSQVPTNPSIAGERLVSRLTTASRRTRRGLDTSLTPGPFLRHVGNVQVLP
jgi:hypothetical protein